MGQTKDLPSRGPYIAKQEKEKFIKRAQGQNIMPQNYFTPLRLFMAFCVAFEHIFYFQAGKPDAPFELGHTSVGYFAVNGFFIISGYLITGSAIRSATLLDFARSRILRIMPALIAVTLMIGLVLAPLLGELTLAAYYSTGTPWVSMLKVVTFADAGPPWPGLVMPDNPFPGDLTGPIWTLRHEVLAYIGTGGLLFLGLHRNKAIALLLAFAVSCAFIVELQTAALSQIAPTLGSLARFASCYLYGICAYLFAPYLKLGWKVSIGGMVLGGVVLWMGFAAGEAVMNLALAPLIFAIAFSNARAPKWLSPKTDYSYGLYIFHWPIYQVLVAGFPGAPMMPLLMLAGLPLAIMAAGLSWHFIEKPALKLKARNNFHPV